MRLTLLLILAVAAGPVATERPVAVPPFGPEALSWDFGSGQFVVRVRINGQGTLDAVERQPITDTGWRLERVEPDHAGGGGLSLDVVFKRDADGAEYGLVWRHAVPPPAFATTRPAVDVMVQQPPPPRRPPR